jgi:hypothetical protein
MYEKKRQRFIIYGVVILSVFAAGFFAGHLRTNGINSRRYGAELESVRAEQRRVEGEYRTLRESLI